MLSEMKQGSVVVDCAASTGGNVEAIEPGKIIKKNGVTLVGSLELSRNVAAHASQMYASNIYNFLNEFLIKDDKDNEISLTLDTSDDIISSMLTTIKGDVVQPMLLKQFKEVGD
jgi:NAD(P) transhydrogenase subunit alpha